MRFPPYAAQDRFFHSFWLKAVFSLTHNMRTKAMCELLIRRRMKIPRQLKQQEQLQVEVQLVRSAENRADALTRVPKKWLVEMHTEGAATMAGIGPRTLRQEIDLAYRRHHFDVSRTLELARMRLGQAVTKQLVK